MKDMYAGTRPFDREQLAFVAEVMLTSVLEMISSQLPHEADAEPPESRHFVDQACWQAGWNLSILFAQLTGEGMGEGDALVCAGEFNEACRRLVAYAWRGDGRHVRERQADLGQPHNIKDLYGIYWVDCRKHADHFVNEVFGDYLTVGVTPSSLPSNTH